MDGFGYLLLFAAIVLAIAAWRRASAFDAKLRDMNLRLAGVQNELARLKGGATPVPDAPKAEEAVLKTAVPAQEVVAGPPSSKAWGGKAVAAAPAPSKSLAETAAAPSESIKETAPAAPRPDVEQAIASKWFVWIGGAAIAVGGVLFVKYASDNNLLPPAFRVIVGLVFGALLVAVAEFLRRAPLKSEGDATYVPAALSAGGLIIGFGSLYAAYGLFDLISPNTAFIGLALIALGAIALSLLQGPLIAALGLLGAYGVPTLISSNDPNAAAFFPYVLIVLAAAFGILQKRQWWWLGFGAIGGAFAWVLLWIMGGVFESADEIPVGVAALGIGVIAATAGARKSPPLALPLSGLAAAMAGLIALVIHTSHADAPVVMLLIGGLGVIAFAALNREVDLAAPAAALAVFAALAIWRDASFFTMAMDESGLWQSAPGPGQARFFKWMIVSGLAFGASGLVLTFLRGRPQIWAAIGAGSLALFGFGAWARLPEFIAGRTWMLAALAVVAVLAVAFLALRKRLADDEVNLAMGLLAIGAALAAIFALDRAFDRVWLTLGLAVLVPILALIHRAIPVKLLGPLATGIAALTALKLFTAHELWSGQGGLPLGDHWVLYGYGVPIALFWFASRLFAGRYRAALEGGALALAISLVSLELRVLIGGGVRAQELGFLEVAAHAMAWLGAGFGLLYRQGLFSSVISVWGARILLAAGTAMTVFGSLLWLNPVNTELPLAGGAIFNALLLAYLAPAILIALVIPRLTAIKGDLLRNPLGVLVLALILAYITLETKRLFQGPVMVIEPLTDAENYAHSAAWLMSALALLVAGLNFRQPQVRYAGLAVMILVVLKVFLWDMSGLGGLWRIASFIGLGLCLVGIGYLYTRFAQKEAGPRPA